MYATANIFIEGWATGRFAGTNYCKKCNDYYGICDLLEPHFGPECAEEVAGWCENASAGDVYEGVGFDVEIE